jgi:hypothetical protein
LAQAILAQGKISRSNLTSRPFLRRGWRIID